MRVTAGLALALVLALAFNSVASAQQSPTDGQVVGEVARCAGAVEVPAPNVSVGIDSGSTSLAQTDKNGAFAITLPSGQYTVVATAADGSTASRPYVPVAAGQALDIGILDLGAGVNGCGFDSSAEPAAVATPTVTPTTPPLLPTVTPTTPPVPTLTPVPDATAAPDDSSNTD